MLSRLLHSVVDMLWRVGELLGASPKGHGVNQGLASKSKPKLPKYEAIEQQSNTTKP